LFKCSIDSNLCHPKRYLIYVNTAKEVTKSCTSRLQYVTIYLTFPRKFTTIWITENIEHFKRNPSCPCTLEYTVKLDAKLEFGSSDYRHCRTVGNLKKKQRLFFFRTFLHFAAFLSVSSCSLINIHIFSKERIYKIRLSLPRTR